MYTQVMDEATRLRDLAAEVRAVGQGLSGSLATVKSRHRGSVWTSRAAESSRQRLLGRHQHALERAETELAAAAGLLVERAQAADAAARGD